MKNDEPGVYVEEIDLGPKPIEGVSTSVCGFVGPTRSGPVGAEPELLTSFADFELIYGGLDDLEFEFADTKATGCESQINYLAYAARAFFENGGRKLYVARIYEPGSDSNQGDGRLPSADSYAGGDTEEGKTGLESLAAINEISIIAAPGYSARSVNLSPEENVKRATQIAQHLIAHCKRLRNRFAVLDSPDQQSPTEVKNFRAQFDSKYAALYYPWVTAVDPADSEKQRQINLPPSGFVAGIYARVDEERGVFKAPANEELKGIVGLKTLLNQRQQDVLNPSGVNCLRHFPGRGFFVWGARTISSDPEWRYVNVRRHFLYIENSIDQGTQWVVFEPNTEELWALVRRLIERFLLVEWRKGGLMGTKPAEAFFVRCDRSTMTQDDIDNGRLICVVGVASIRPAEFVIFRIGQWTAEHRD
jgi:phage tail sheath protein FI